MFDFKLHSPFLDMILSASLLVQAVMLLLLLMSIYSWTLILRKRKALRRARQEADSFEGHFWKGRDLNQLYNRVTAHDYSPSGLENIFIAGYTEFARLRKQGKVPPMDMITATQRAMRVVLQREVEVLEYQLPVLATTGSVSPYIGLFGTVWGIMNSFHALGNVQQATLSMVAPGISEALVATAMGLFAAIPAVMAYNNYVTEIDRIAGRYDLFSDEFTNILQRQAHATASSAETTPPATASAAAPAVVVMSAVPATV